MHQVFLAETTYQRMRDDFDRISGVEYVTMDVHGTLKSGGKELNADDFVMTTLLMDIDFFVLNQMEAVFKMINKAESLEYVHTAAAGLDNPVFRQIAEKAKVFCNSDAQAPAIADKLEQLRDRWVGAQMTTAGRARAGGLPSRA